MSWRTHVLTTVPFAAKRRPYWVPASEWVRGEWVRPLTKRGAPRMSRLERLGEVRALEDIRALLRSIENAIAPPPTRESTRRMMAAPHWQPKSSFLLAAIARVTSTPEERSALRGSQLLLAHAASVAAELACELISDVAEFVGASRRPKGQPLANEFLMGYVPVYFEAARSLSVVAAELRDPFSSVRRAGGPNPTPIVFLPSHIDEEYLRALHCADAPTATRTAIDLLKEIESRINWRINALTQWRRGAVASDGTREPVERYTGTAPRASIGRPREFASSIDDSKLVRIFEEKTARRARDGLRQSAMEVYREIARDVFKSGARAKTPTDDDVEAGAILLKRRHLRYRTSTLA